MTLVLTELTRLGVAMAADSTVTFTHTATGRSFATPGAARKLQIVPNLAAGVSCWGMGTIGGLATDEWLSNFIASNAGIRDLASFANQLTSALQTTVGSSPAGQSRLGFHLAGIEDHDGQPVPSFYHIHDGPSTTLAARGVSVDPSRFNANHDMPPAEFVNLVATKKRYITRNGDYQLYGHLFRRLEAFFADLATVGIQIPHSQQLPDRAEYLVFQIRTVASLYRMSNLVPGIGGPISYLTITPAGVQSEGTSYV